MTLSTLNLQENDTTPTEHQLFGDNFGKIKLLRFINGHLDDLLNVNGNGKFDKHEILELIKWCDVKESPKKHEDSERILFELIKSRYHGSHRWYGWPSIFTLNQTIKDSGYESMLYSERFERKLNRFLVDCGLKREDITGECTQK